MSYNHIQNIRYMGNKNRLLNWICPILENNLTIGDTICDIMAGTHSIGYALKPNYRIISNDVQMYSHTIGKAIIENNSIRISSEIASNELFENYMFNLANAEYSFFKDNYSDTYFSASQCLEIDSIKYAIDRLSCNIKKSLYLTVLMNSMSRAQSTPGHFAQYLPMDHKRVQALRDINIWTIFLDKCNDYFNLDFNNFNNTVYNLEYREFLDTVYNENINLYYLDPPYSNEQYSRFYHILETLVRYDNPALKHKGLYREDRFKSNFCYKSKVEDEFDYICNYVSSKNSILAISYSNKGVISIDELLRICNSHFSQVEIFNNQYNHSTQGKGNTTVNEILIVAK